MGNIVTTLKRFISNKNTVTILGVLLGIVVLYIGYNYRVNAAVQTVSIPYARNTLTSTTTITQDDIEYMEVLTSFVNNNQNVIRDINSLVGQLNSYCVQVGTSIPAGAFFYQEQVIDCRNISSNALDRMPDGYSAVSLEVNLQSTYGNSMYPEDYIDIYVRTTTEEGKLVYGQFITKLPILDVRDSNGRSLFYDSSSSGTPAILLFAVPNYDIEETNLYLLLSRATMLNNIELIPVPGNANYTAEVGETEVTSQYLRQIIENQTVTDIY